jgi:hypothetical protein
VFRPQLREFLTVANLGVLVNVLQQPLAKLIGVEMVTLLLSSREGSRVILFVFLSTPFHLKKNNWTTVVWDEGKDGAVFFYRTIVPILQRTIGNVRLVVLAKAEDSHVRQLLTFVDGNGEPWFHLEQGPSASA